MAPQNNEQIKASTNNQLRSPNEHLDMYLYWGYIQHDIMNRNPIGYS